MYIHPRNKQTNKKNQAASNTSTSIAPIQWQLIETYGTKKNSQNHCQGAKSIDGMHPPKKLTDGWNLKITQKNPMILGFTHLPNLQAPSSNLQAPSLERNSQPNLNFSNNTYSFSHNHGSGKWLYLKGNDPIGDTPIFDGTMIMGGSVSHTQKIHHWLHELIRIESPTGFGCSWGPNSNWTTFCLQGFLAQQPNPFFGGKNTPGFNIVVFLCLFVSLLIQCQL